MTFEEWANEYALDDDYPTRTGREIDCRAAWEAAIAECAKIADARATRCKKWIAIAESDDEATELRSLAWQFSVLAEEIRKRSNA